MTTSGTWEMGPGSGPFLREKREHAFDWIDNHAKLNELEEGEKVVRIRDKMIHFRVGAKSVLVVVEWAREGDTWDWRLLALGKWVGGGGVTESRIDHRWANEEATKAFVPLHPLFCLSVTYYSFKLPIIFVHTHTPLDVSSPYSHIDTIPWLKSQAPDVSSKIESKKDGMWVLFDFSSSSYNVLRFVWIIFPHRNLRYISKSTMKHQQKLVRSFRSQISHLICHLHAHPYLSNPCFSHHLCIPQIESTSRKEVKFSPQKSLGFGTKIKEFVPFCLFILFYFSECVCARARAH